MELWEIAEEQDIPESDLVFAINYYISKGELTPTLSHD